ncbi:MAG TPA: S9 family peptidase [Gemmatimonadaceae bacterium]|nr:S9 family peptidase [Gemmatimonadaceae bacterium]
MRTKLAALGLVLLPAALAAQNQQAPRAFTTADWYRVSTVGNPALSPDGRIVAFTVTTVKEKENKRHTEIWVVPTAGGDPVRYTSPGTESSNPRFNHDGTVLLFTSSRPGGKGRTWGLRMDRPGGEAFEVTDYPEGSMPSSRAFAVWSEPASPDSAADSTKKGSDPWAGMDATARPPFGAITRPLDAKRFDGMHFTETRFKANGRGYLPGPREARKYRPAQIWMQRFGDSVKTQIDTTIYSRRNASVSPDGRWIAFVADTGLRADSVVEAIGDSISMLPYDAARDERPDNNVDIFVIPVAGGAPRRVASFTGNESGISWSPDSRRIAFSASPSRTASERIYVVSAAGGEPVNILGDWKYEPGSYEWLSNGDMMMSAAIGGRTALFRLQPDSKRLTEVIGGRRRLSSFSYDRAMKSVAYVSTSLTKPTELYLAGIDGTNERKVTGFNDALNAEIAWSDAERFTYPSTGGLEIEGWLMKPFGYEPGKKYPLVLYIHGGPHSAYGENWFDEFQNLAGAGMFVLFTNPRGSSGYGADFTYATRGRWFAEDYEDLMNAVDIAARRPDVDSTRMGVTGGSYGGVMTAWVTAKTNRFKAAQTDRMISNWWSWYGSSDAAGLTEFEFYGKPWDNPAMYDSLSPIRYIRNVRTPTLMVQSEEDFRTPMTDAEQWYLGLKKQGTPVEFVRYPRSTHELSRSGEPWLLVDRLGRLRQWFGYWLLDRKPGIATDEQTSSSR